MFGEPWGYGDYGQFQWSSGLFSPLRLRPGSFGAYDQVLRDDKQKRRCYQRRS
jgi:hypothetical protein